MDLKSALAASPWLRKAWKLTPAPLRVPLVVLAGVVLVWRWARGRGGEDAVSVDEHVAQEQGQQPANATG